MNNLIVNFAILWGEFIGGAIISSKEMMLAEEMKMYDTEELLNIFSTWAEEYNENAESDVVTFFEEKLTDLMHE